MDDDCWLCLLDKQLILKHFERPRCSKNWLALEMSQGLELAPIGPTMHQKWLIVFEFIGCPIGASGRVRCSALTLA